jgi:hypothetical protein
MLPWLLASGGIGALTGGAQAYQQSRGDVGKTLLGSLAGGGLGLATGGLGLGAMRFAGQALAPVAAGAAEAVAAPGLLGQAARMAASPVGQTALKTVIPGAAGFGAAALGEKLLSPAAAATANLAAQTTGAAGAMGVGRPDPSGQFVSPGGSVPDYLSSQAHLPSTYDVLSPTGPYAASRLTEELAQDVQLKGMKKMMPYLYQAAEARSKSEMERQMAAAQIRQNISTAANLVQRGQQAAQQMGLTAAQQMGSALTAQYQYQ